MAKKVLVNLDMHGNEIQNVVMQILATAPTSPKEGQYYYNSADGKAYQYVRTSEAGITPATYAWKPLGGAEITVDSTLSSTSTNPVQNKAVSTGLVKSFDSTSTDSTYTIKGKAANGSEVTSVEIPGATKLKAGLLTAADKQNIDGIKNKANKSEAIGNLAISGGTTISWTAVDGSSPEPDSITIPNATTTTAGAMSAADKTKLDGIASGANKVDGLAYTNGTSGVDTAIKSGTTSVATATIPAATDSAYGVVKVDSALKTDSVNPVQNKVINSALGDKANKREAARMNSFYANQTSNGIDIIYDSVDTIDVANFTILEATDSAYGVVKLDSSVTASGKNPVTGKAIYDYVGDAIAASDAMIFKGTIGTDGTVTALPTTYKTGWTYRVTTAGTYASQDCEEGDLIIALVDRDGTGNLDSDWTVAQTNIDGAITDINATTPITVSGSGTSRTIGHANSGVTAGSYGLASNVTPSFGATFDVPYVTVDAKGHITSGKTNTVTIPNSTASSSSAGLMSADAYNKLYSLVSSSIQTKTGTLSTGSKTLSLPVSPESPAEIINVSVRTPSGETVVTDVDIDPSGSTVDVTIAQGYSTDLMVTVWYTVTE